MVDPLAEVVTLLQPTARFSKNIVGAGAWQIRRSDAGQPFYCAVLEGACRLTLDGHEPIVLQAGDFLLVPAVFGVAMSSLDAPAGAADSMPVALGPGRFRIGVQDGPTDLRILAGHCSFGSPDAALLVSLLPQLVHVRGEPRLATLVQWVGQESSAQRPARELVLARLLEVLLIEALRSTTGTATSPGLARGLADARLAAAIRAMHEQPTRAWTVAELAREAALSRSTFFERFHRAVGLAPMAYLLAWRMALAKDLLRRDEGSIADIAERVGYSSASTFSVAFARHVGRPPTHYAREQAAFQRLGA
ncbi:MULTISPECIES: AraC family transcriptional regulator [unclassified Rhizobacter]|uniref:AraC family transcriptional regulator n=1 Tax=unclassified Rhizobacter TaxID=2640088 RepID=UPI0006FA0D17|nr:MULTISPECIES: AraC family transcriptional regulator [unclassified Rhizobacter]KQU71458.1 AraC family transcriptional regulator [Rhizobacter sp. Root29]KQW13052.1 AraC family transcriptional regulator [Rhizobacter sp. Root1238]KRB14359.1 AraC family transcriptional regulator [Rhizobacter sp. Root16D2]